MIFFWLVVWNMNGICSINSWEWKIIPADELAYFFRGLGQPATRKLWYIIYHIHPNFLVYTTLYRFPPTTNQYELWYSFSGFIILIFHMFPTYPFHFPNRLVVSSGFIPTFSQEKVVWCSHPGHRLNRLSGPT